MSREKQIEEMAKVLCNSIMCDLETFDNCRMPQGNCSRCQRVAKDLYNADYRKQSEVAKEIFDEIERTFKGLLNGDISNVLKLLSTLKKEYVEQKLDEPENRQVQCGELDRQPRKAV